MKNWKKKLAVVLSLALIFGLMSFVSPIGENGKVAKVDLSAYETKTNRKKLIGAYSDKATISCMLKIDEDTEVLIKSTSGKQLLVHTGVITPKSTKNTQGVAVMKQNKGHRLLSAEVYAEGSLNNPNRYRVKNIPAAGQFPTSDEQGEQLTF